MTDRTNIALPSVEAVATMTEPELRALLVQLAAHEQQLAAGETRANLAQVTAHGTSVNVAAGQAPAPHHPHDRL